MVFRFQTQGTVRRQTALLLWGLGLAVLALFWAHDFSLTSLQRRPIICQPGLPENAEGLLTLVETFGYSGVQMSIRDVRGQWSDCAAGWADWRGLGKPGQQFSYSNLQN